MSETFYHNKDFGVSLFLLTALDAYHGTHGESVPTEFFKEGGNLTVSLTINGLEFPVFETLKAFASASEERVKAMAVQMLQEKVQDLWYGLSQATENLREKLTWKIREAFPGVPLDDDKD